MEKPSASRKRTVSRSCSGVTVASRWMPRFLKSVIWQGTGGGGGSVAAGGVAESAPASAAAYAGGGGGGDGGATRGGVAGSRRRMRAPWS
ncbi:MAG: hypothetical protein ACO34E_05855 [Limisphaerales bacterium]